MGYRQNNPNYRQGGFEGFGSGGLAEILQLIMSGHQPQGPQPIFMPQRPDRQLNRGPGPGNDTPYVIGGGPGGTYEDEVYPGDYNPGSILMGLGRLLGGASNVLPIPYGGLIGRGLQAGGRQLGGGQDFDGPPELVNTPVPRSVVGGGWDHLFRGDSEFFWNSIQPGVRNRIGGSYRDSMDPYGAFLGSGGWGTQLY